MTGAGLLHIRHVHARRSFPGITFLAKSCNDGGRALGVVDIRCSPSLQRRTTRAQQRGAASCARSTRTQNHGTATQLNVKPAMGFTLPSAGLTPAPRVKTPATSPSAADHPRAHISNTNTADYKRSHCRSSPPLSPPSDSSRNSPATRTSPPGPTPTSASPVAAPAAHSQSTAPPVSNRSTRQPRYP